MGKFLTKKNITILAFISLALFIFAFFYKPKQPLPKLISSLPVQGAQKVSLTKPISLKFDQPINLSLLTVISSPTEEWSTQSDYDLSVVTLKSKQYFHAETQYELSILYNNELISNLNFKTVPQQGDPRYTQGVLKQMDIDYPLAIKLPYTTSNYKVVYSEPLTLEISLKNPNLSSAEVIDEIRAWVTRNGGDVNAHKYVVITE